ARIGHVLTDQMRRLGDGEKVLREAALRAAERANPAVAPGLPCEPLDEIVAVLLRAPPQGSIAGPDALGELRAAKTHAGGDVAVRGEGCEFPSRSGAGNDGVTLLEDGRPGSPAR